MGFVKARGCDLYFEEKGRGQSILLIPPSGATASMWGTLADELADVGRVIVYRRGYARSCGGVVRSAAVHTADAAAVVEALDAAPAMVVGTSAGATIALDLAVRRPDLVRAVVAHEAPWRALLHPDVSAPRTLLRVQRLAWQGRYDAAAEHLLRYVYAYRDGGSAWDAFPEQWRRIARENGRSVVADLWATLGSYPSHARLANMTPPVVCTHGSRSRNYMRATTRSRPGPSRRPHCGRLTALRTRSRSTRRASSRKSSPTGFTPPKHLRRPRPSRSRRTGEGAGSSSP